MMSQRPTRILILGGGFGGVYTALTLEKLLAFQALFATLPSLKSFFESLIATRSR